MMRIRSTRLFSATLVAGAILLVGLPRGDAQFGEEKFGLGEKNEKLHFTTSLGTSDPFANLNQPTGGKARRGSTFQVILHGTLAKGFHTFPITRRTPNQEGQLSQVKIEAGPSFVPLFPPIESENFKWDSGGGKLNWSLEHEEPFTWTFEFYVKPDAPVGSTQQITFKIHAQVCDRACYFEDLVVTVSVPIGSEETLADSIDLAKLSKPIPPVVVPLRPGMNDPPPEAPGGVAPPPGPKDSRRGRDASDVVSVESQVPKGLLQAILIAVGGGFVSLLTPCVFPMIPITVSFFLHQSEKKKAPLLVTAGTGIQSAPTAVEEPMSGSPLLMALVYSLTIVFVLAVGGLVLGSFLTRISAHPVTNFALGAIFLFFGLSLFGWYDVTLPSWLQDATSSGEGRGGLLGVFFMALTFSIVSFSCVGPIYGIFIAGSASGSTGQFQLILSIVSFAVAFASPFFLLALFPQLLKSMPRAGSWMNSVKVVMGFLEVAAVVKFLRAGELASTGAAEYLSYDLCLGIYIALCVACSLYLLGVYQLPHDHEAPETIGVPRLLFSLGFLTLALYIMPGMFKASGGQSMQPRGIVFGWIDSFLLPDPESSSSEKTSPTGQSLVWHHKLTEALELAKKENKLVFLDFTGTLCTNCKLNERYAFPRPEIQSAFAQLVLLKLYTDKTPAGVEQEPAEVPSLALRNSRFKTDALPHYALLEPVGDDFRIVRSYTGNLIQTAAERKAFVEFLTAK